MLPPLPYLTASFLYCSSGTPEVKELDDHLGNTDRRGEYFFRIEDRQGDDATAQCFIWHDYQTSNMQSQLQNAVGSLTSCPCSFWQAFFDTRFLFFGISKGDLCFTSVTTIFINTDIGGDPVFAFARQKCCYSFPFLDEFNSFLTLSFVDRPDELLDDETAERLCCDESNNCDLYYEVRPLDFCDDYFPIPRRKFSCTNSLCSKLSRSSYCAKVGAKAKTGRRGRVDRKSLSLLSSKGDFCLRRCELFPGFSGFRAFSYFSQNKQF